jgi:toxin ParE1/3/4
VPSVVFSPAARAELLEARDRYAARDVVLADRFVAEIETIVERIGTEPQQFPVVYQDIWRARRRCFPYALFFRVIAWTVRVIAYFHSSRDPRRWQRRN